MVFFKKKMYLAPEKVDVILAGMQLPSKFLFAYCT